jgi:hypothetical protein
LIYILTLAWASRQDYLHYESHPLKTLLEHPPAGEAPLRPEELVPVRASGWFSVEGKEKYYVDLEADFETVASREHILLGRVRPSRYLRLGSWPVEDLGWWYVFFHPVMILGLDLGLLYFGPEAQQVLRVIYQQDEKVTQTIYLAFESNIGLRRVWTDLLLDASPDVILPNWIQGKVASDKPGSASGAMDV